MKKILLGFTFGILSNFTSVAGPLDNTLRDVYPLERLESIESLTAIAKRAHVTDILAFLHALPGGTYPTFTLITNSRSLQRGTGDGVVSDLWPRVVRTSSDGKITLSYVCNPTSTAYNRIEVMFFEDSSQTFRSMTYDLAHRSQLLDQKMCLSCHTLHMKPSTFQPIWPENRNWRDCDDRRGISLYGGLGDRIGLSETVDRRDVASSPNKIPFGCGPEEDRQMQLRETEAFENFRKVQKDNPCYASLPWPAAAEVSNTKLTVTYTRLVAKKNARVLRADKNLSKIEPYLLLEGLGCLGEEDYAVLSKLLGTRIEPPRERSPVNPRVEAPVLYRFGTLVGLRPRDWNLVQNANEASYATGTEGMAGLVLGELMENQDRSCEEIRQRLKPMDGTTTSG